MGSCTPFDEVPELRLSANGNAVMALWTGGGQPVNIYTQQPE